MSEGLTFDEAAQRAGIYRWIKDDTPTHYYIVVTTSYSTSISKTHSNHSTNYINGVTFFANFPEGSRVKAPIISADDWEGGWWFLCEHMDIQLCLKT